MNKTQIRNNIEENLFIICLATFFQFQFSKLDEFPTNFNDFHAQIQINNKQWEKSHLLLFHRFFVRSSVYPLWLDFARFFAIYVLVSNNIVIRISPWLKYSKIYTAKCKTVIFLGLFLPSSQLYSCL